MDYFNDMVKAVKDRIKFRSNRISKATVEVALLKDLFDKYGDSPDRFFHSCKGILHYEEEFIETEKEELKELEEELARYKELAK